MTCDPAGHDWDDRMRAALAGDDAAYRMLLTAIARAARPVIRAGLVRAGRGNADAEDIVQEVLLAVHLKRHTWDRARPLRSWINAILRYKLIDALRRRGFHDAIAIDEVAPFLPYADSEPRERPDTVRLLSALPARDREIVQRVFFEGQSAKEAGAALGIDAGTLRVALHRAVKKLAALYRAQETIET